MNEYIALLEKMAGKLLARTTHGAAELADLIRQGAPPHVARFGDGEIQCALEFPGGNCDKHPYTKSLARELLRALYVFVSTPNLWLGNWFWYPYGPWVHAVADYNSTQPVQWCPHEIFMHLELYDPVPVRDIFLALQDSTRRKIIVRPEELAGADGFLRAEGVTCATINAWENYARLKQTVLSAAGANDMILLCCGMPAKPLMADLIEAYPQCCCLDIGSGLDPLFKSRISREKQLNKAQLHALYAGLL